MCKKIGIIGSGSWGTAVSQHLALNENQVKIWGRDRDVLDSIDKNSENPKYLKGLKLSNNIKSSESLQDLVKDSDVIVFCLPSNFSRKVVEEISSLDLAGKVLISSSKGLETNSSLRGSELIKEVLGDKTPIWVLSGPSFALEIAKGLPTAMVLATDNNAVNQETEITNLFHRGNLRIYSSKDIVGVELGGVLKNVVSIAAGIGDGLGLGLNARASLLTRGLKEICNLIEVEGGKLSTVIGLSGLGDLILTSTGDLSRNRTFGVSLGRGATIEEAIKEVGYTIEALTSSKAAVMLADRHNMEVPIISQVAGILEGKQTPANALRELLTREQRAE